MQCFSFLLWLVVGALQPQTVIPALQRFLVNSRRNQSQIPRGKVHRTKASNVRCPVPVVRAKPPMAPWAMTCYDWGKIGAAKETILRHEPHCSNHVNNTLPLQPRDKRPGLKFRWGPCFTQSFGELAQSESISSTEYQKYGQWVNCGLSSTYSWAYKNHLRCESANGLLQGTKSLRWAAMKIPTTATATATTPAARGVPATSQVSPSKAWRHFQDQNTPTKYSFIQPKPLEGPIADP